MGEIQFIAIIAGFIVLVIFTSIMSARSNPYPDGKCYLCRRNNADQGETCPKCDTEQP